MPYFELQKDELRFPPAYFADLDGLLAVGGDMTPKRLLLSYTSGIFYWHHPLKHIKWWSPDPRLVIFPHQFGSLEERYFGSTSLRTTGLTDFNRLLRFIQHQNNDKQNMTPAWLSERMVRMFLDLFEGGYIQGVEVWKKEDLVGGSFGVHIGRHFYGEYTSGLSEEIAITAVRALVECLREAGVELMDMHKETACPTSVQREELARLEYVDRCKQNFSIANLESGTL